MSSLGAGLPKTPSRDGVCWVIVCVLVLIGVFGSAHGLTPSQVVVIYNSEAADSEAVYQYYAAARPGVRGFNLDDASLGAGTISYADYLAKLRNPLRAHLVANDLEEEVVVFVLTRGMPHRIQDLTAGNIGDNPTGAYNRINAGQATYASVDSELTLLWQDLEAGENGGVMDSAADNNVLNPYFNDSTPITNYSRSSITGSKKFIQTSGPRWQMRDQKNGPVTTPGGICLTARLDGDSLAAVQGLIDRGVGACYDSQTDYIIQDKDVSNGTIDSGDLGVAAQYMQSGWSAFTFEQTNTFLIGMSGDLKSGNSGTQRFSGRIAALTGYGGNHSGGSKAGFMSTYQGQLSTGAIYNGYESYNAKRFGGVGGYSDHGQLSEWANVGGTFGVGSAWEPLASGIPRNSALLRNFFLEGRTWVEAAWSSSYYLSWQMVVLGDPPFAST